MKPKHTEPKTNTNPTICSRGWITGLIMSMLASISISFITMDTRVHVVQGQWYEYWSKFYFRLFRFHFFFRMNFYNCISVVLNNNVSVAVGLSIRINFKTNICVNIRISFRISIRIIKSDLTFSLNLDNRISITISPREWTGKITY